MLSFFRLIARPLSLVALLALLAPGWAECRSLAQAAAADRLSCCLKTEAQHGNLDSGCCAVGRAPESQQVPATTVTGRTAPASIDATSGPVAVPAAAVVRSPFDANAECGSPGPPLYLRLSSIRR